MMLEEKRLNGPQTETKIVDEAKGIVEAIVSVTNIIDEVGDIILPGAYRATLTKRMPKVVFNHSWDQPVGKVLAAEELMPGDPRLPARLNQVGAGCLKARLQFNMGTERGRDAYSDVAFYGDQGEWSIGYDCTSPGSGQSKMNSHGIREISALTLFEMSPVLFGAAPLTGTTDIKRFAPLLAAVQSKAKGPMTAAAKDPADGKKVCPTCDGTGKILNGNVTCKSCSGSGVVASDWKPKASAPPWKKDGGADRQTKAVDHSHEHAHGDSTHDHAHTHGKAGSYGHGTPGLPDGFDVTHAHGHSADDPEVTPVTNNWPPQSHEAALLAREQSDAADSQTQVWKENLQMSTTKSMRAALQSKAHVCLEGSYEDTTDDLNDMAQRWFAGQVPMLLDAGCWIEATYPDHVILGVWYSGDNDDPCAPRQKEFWQVPYTRDTANDSYTFGTPAAVDITGVAVVKPAGVNAGPALQVLSLEETIAYGQKNATRIRRRILLLDRAFGQDVSSTGLTEDQISKMGVGGGMIPAAGDPSYLDNIMDTMPEGGAGPGNNFTNPPTVTPVGSSYLDHAGDQPAPAVVAGTYYLDDAGNLTPTAIGVSTDWMNLGDSTVGPIAGVAMPDSYQLGDQPAPALDIPAHQPGTLALADEPPLQNAAGNGPGSLSTASHPEGETKATNPADLSRPTVNDNADADTKPDDPAKQNAGFTANQSGPSDPANPGQNGKPSLLDQVRQRQSVLGGARFHSAGKAFDPDQVLSDLADASVAVLQWKAKAVAAPAEEVAPEFDMDKLKAAHASIQAVLAQEGVVPASFGLPQNVVSGNDEEGVPIQAVQAKGIKGLPMDEILAFQALTLSLDDD
jgi:phage head maturation protease